MGLTAGVPNLHGGDIRVTNEAIRSVIIRIRSGYKVVVFPNLGAPKRFDAVYFGYISACKRIATTFYLLYLIDRYNLHH